MCFVVDLFLNFFTAVYVKDSPSSTSETISTSMRVIALSYLTSWFPVDFVSSVPIDLIVNLMVHGCSGGPSSAVVSTALNGTAGSSEGNDSSQLKLLKMIRILRLVKLLKILRVLKANKYIEDINDRFPAIVNNTGFKLLMPFFATLYFAHLLGAMFYWTGATQYYIDTGDLVDDKEQQALSWLYSSSLNMNDERGLSWAQLGPHYIAALCAYTTSTHPPNHTHLHRPHS